jgi:hypothetical protein
LRPKLPVSPAISRKLEQEPKPLAEAPHNLNCPGAKRMAANAKQGTYLGTTLTGFTALVAGLYVGGGIGIVVAIVGAGLLVVSAAGFYKIKTI